MRTSVPEFLARRCQVVVLTGAGVSAESGVPTFRGASGLWQGFRPEELARPGTFARDPGRVWRWYEWRRRLVARCRPNAAHRALARTEAMLPGLRLITQNVDGLHQEAGSYRVIELHGSLWKVCCTGEGWVREDWRVPLPQIPPRCECGALLRPHVVWFGETLHPGDLERALQATHQAELFLVVGTSGVIDPAASLPRLARGKGAYLVEVNPDATPLTSLAHESHRGPAVEVLPELLGAEQERP
ncbi:MAG: NAD-dependent deacylase [Nitrospinota bacterium]